MQIVVAKADGALAPVRRILDTSEAERRHAESLALFDVGLARLESDLDAARAGDGEGGGANVDKALALQAEIARRTADRATLADNLAAFLEPLADDEEAIFLSGWIDPPGPVEALDWDRNAAAFEVNATRLAALTASAKAGADAEAARRAYVDKGLDALRGKDASGVADADLLRALRSLLVRDGVLAAPGA